MELRESWDMAEVTVPAGTVFVLGDNRPLSLDSRSPLLGPVPEGEVVCVVLFHAQVPLLTELLKGAG